MSYTADYGSFERLYQEKLRRGETSWSSGLAEREIIPCFLTDLLAAASIEHGGSVLEVGCGAGDLSFYLVQQGYRVTGIDVSPTAIMMAKSRAIANGADVSFMACNILDVPSLPLEKFDCVLDGLCLHCIVGADRDSFFQSIHYVLKENGLFIIMTMCGDPKGIRISSMYDECTRNVYNQSTAERYLGLAEDIIGEIQRANFILEYIKIVEGDAVSGDQDMLLCVARKKLKLV
ncbi:class I SAM-dependent methyltransferase [Tolypothrix sp. LEGE 11397]|uniref:class I SAM-dependent methyltransferase n=1 Tax=Tolypothrix sp. LEGE 11397 TaxID=2777971 RepID=UPI00187E3039|nr:class I SAM-dependent methyltransferase [Tolypothrix sp. LEGE 11397]MBE9082833.1 class I SAM-dependent methyltransferase [Tolypothrix sp. LEGE 11397]